MEKYFGSLEGALRNLFPQFNWNELSNTSLIMQASKPQKSLESFTKYWFPNELIYINYRHPGFLNFLFLIVLLILS